MTNPIAQINNNLSPEEKRALLAKLIQKQNDRAEASEPLSYMQQGLWSIYQFAPQSWAYNVLFSAKIISSIDLEAFRKSLQILVDRHESLRANYTTKSGIPIQKISSLQAINLEIVDAANWDETELNDRITAIIRLPFDLEKEPVMRVTLLAKSATEYIFLLVIHHIAVDLWSVTVLLDELRSIYPAIVAGNPVNLPPLQTQYRHYIQWQSQILTQARGKQLQDYWQTKLAGELPILDLPTDRPRPPIQTFAGASQTFTIEENITKKLRNLAKAEGASLYAVLLSALKVLLYRYSGRKDIIVGSAAACRNGREFTGVVGACINPLVLRDDLTGNPSFSALLARVKDTLLEALQHQEYPFQLLVQQLPKTADLSRSPLFQVMFLLQKLHRSEDLADFIIPVDSDATIDFGGLAMQPFPVAHQEGQFDLMLETIETVGRLKFILKYNPLLFELSTITRIVAHFQNLLTSIVDNPHQSIDCLSLLNIKEEKQLLIDWNQTKTNYPATSIQKIFEAQVEATPDAVALVYLDRQLTYLELNQKANQLARYIRGLGIKAESLIGVYLDRSLDTIVSLLAILKAGCAYLPLDLSYPQERLDYMLWESKVKLVLTQASLGQQIENESIKLVYLDREESSIELLLDNNLEDTTNPDNLAYINYTSGSTGKPKGVCVTHRGVVRLVMKTNYANFSDREVFLQLAPISFDAATLEIWGCLLHGAKLILYPDRTPDLETLARIIDRHQVSFLWLTAALFNLVIDEKIEALKPVRQLLAGGDILSIRHVRKALATLDNCQLINGYGPTENTTFTCCYPIRELEANCTSIPIGKPIANTRVYILDKHLQPVPIGVVGELYIGGDGLATGYLHRKDLTNEKFIDNPFAITTEKLYKTGDLVRYLPDGNIEFIGRVDNQVKIRGFRIELGEIEATISQHSAVKDAIVIVWENLAGDKCLVAYIIPQAGETIDPNILNEYLASKLPKYEIPSTYLFLEAFPISPNGKIQRQSLPKPDFSQPASNEEEIKPRNEIERQLGEIWQKVLNVTSVGRQDDFFSLGGNSLLTIRIIAEIQKTFSQQIPVSAFLELSTIERLAVTIQKSIDNNNSTAILEANPEINPDTDDNFPQLTYQERDWLLASTITKKRALNDRSLIMLEREGDPQQNKPLFFVYLLGDLSKYFPPQQTVYNLTVWTKVERSETFVKALAAHYVKEICAIQPEGPYHIAGYCVGGSIALEIAIQLQQQGREVAHLSLIQTTSPDRNYQRLQAKILKFGYDFWFRLLGKWREIRKLNNSVDRLNYFATKLDSLLIKLKLKKEKNRSTSEIETTVISPQKLKEIQYNADEKSILQSLKDSMQYYQPEPYSGDASLFFAKEGRLISFAFPDGGWQKILKGNLNIYKLSSDHTGIVTDPQASSLIELLYRVHYQDDRSRD